MAVSFASYEIARSGLFVNERGLYVTGHNISNVNTPGYVRQQAMITTGPYQTDYNKNGMFQLGLGADIEQIRQIRHTFLDNIYRQENTTLGYWESRNKTFQDVQAILGDPMGAGLQNTLNQFWDSWQELSKAPDSLTVRALVRQRGEALTHQINHIGDQLDKLQNDLNSEIQVRINEINDITLKIANLNVQILKVEVSKDTANDYRDQRNSLLDRLSKLANVEVNEMQDGQLTVTLGGNFLVNRGVQTKLYAGEKQTGGLFIVPKIEGTNIEVPVRSGILKGLMESRGEVLGSTGSLQNGTPNTKADIVFAIDNSNGSAANLANIKSQVAKYVDGLKKSGLDYNIRLITYGTSAVLDSATYDKTTIDNFMTAVNSITEQAGDDGNNFSEVVNTMTGGITFRNNANKCALVFTQESINGNEVDVDNTTLQGYIDALKNNNIATSIITDSSYMNAGDPAGGWNSIAQATGGKSYAMNTDYGILMEGIALDISAVTKPVDINLVIDNSKGSAANLANIKSSILNYVNMLDQQGLNYNLRLITYGSSASTDNVIYDKNNRSGLIAAVNAITENTADSTNDFGAAVSQLQAINSGSGYRAGADKYAVVFTGESVGGEEVDINSATMSGYAAALSAMGMKTSVAGNSVYFNSGDTGGGWSAITTTTGGKLYAINADYGKLMSDVNTGVNKIVNQSFSVVGESNNIIPDLRKRLNSLINIMAREVNSLHRSGTTMGNPGQPGDDFFSAINDVYPIEMRNIKLNDKLLNLNNIVSSVGGTNGDNTIALNIANLRNQSLIRDVNGILNLDDYYQSTILSVGSGGSDAVRISDNQQKLVVSADAYRQSITGVSMDEEMTTMMKYKYAYDASSRAINVIDEMIDTIISRMGITGR